MTPEPDATYDVVAHPAAQRGIQADLRLRPDQAREHLADLDAIAPHNAPHFVALAGGEEV